MKNTSSLKDSGKRFVFVDVPWYIKTRRLLIREVKFYFHRRRGGNSTSAGQPVTAGLQWKGGYLLWTPGEMSE